MPTPAPFTVDEALDPIPEVDDDIREDIIRGAGGSDELPALVRRFRRLVAPFYNCCHTVRE